MAAIVLDQDSSHPLVVLHNCKTSIGYRIFVLPHTERNSRSSSVWKSNVLCGFIYVEPQFTIIPLRGNERLSDRNCSCHGKSMNISLYATFERLLTHIFKTSKYVLRNEVRTKSKLNQKVTNNSKCTGTHLSLFSPGQIYVVPCLRADSERDTSDGVRMVFYMYFGVNKAEVDDVKTKIIKKKNPNNTGIK